MSGGRNQNSHEELITFLRLRHYGITCSNVHKSNNITEKQIRISSIRQYGLELRSRQGRGGGVLGLKSNGKSVSYIFICSPTLAINLFVLTFTGCKKYRNQELSVLMKCPYFLGMKLTAFSNNMYYYQQCLSSSHHTYTHLLDLRFYFFYSVSLFI